MEEREAAELKELGGPLTFNKEPASFDLNRFGGS